MTGWVFAEEVFVFGGGGAVGVLLLLGEFGKAVVEAFDEEARLLDGGGCVVRGFTAVGGFRVLEAEEECSCVVEILWKRKQV